MNQKGIAPLAVVLVALAMIALGAGAFIFLRGGDDTDTPARETVATDSSEPAGEEGGTFSGSYFDTIARGEAVQCKWRLPEEVAGDFQVGEGDFYTDGISRGRSDATFQSNDSSFAAHSIFQEDAVYNWTELTGGGAAVGFKINRASLEAEAGEMSEEERQRAEEIRAQYSFDCQPWTVDESKFQLPGGVTFQELGN